MSNYTGWKYWNPEILALPAWQEVGWPTVPWCVALPIEIVLGVILSMGRPPLDENSLWPHGWCSAQSPTPVKGTYVCLRRQHADSFTPPLLAFALPLPNLVPSPPDTFPLFPHIQSSRPSSNFLSSLWGPCPGRTSESDRTFLVYDQYTLGRIQ